MGRVKLLVAVSGPPRVAKARAKRPLSSFFGTTAPIDPVRSFTMSRIRAKDTGPELRLRRALWRRGARFRVHSPSLPGKPDLANRRAKVAVFVDGCFWHGCPTHFRRPKTRGRFWSEKIKRNQERRQVVLQQYGPDWSVFEVFECKLREKTPRAVSLIASALLKHPQALSGPSHAQLPGHHGKGRRDSRRPLR